MLACMADARINWNSRLAPYPRLGLYYGDVQTAGSRYRLFENAIDDKQYGIVMTISTRHSQALPLKHLCSVPTSQRRDVGLTRASFVVSLTLHLLVFAAALLAHYLSRHMGKANQEECFMVSLIHPSHVETHVTTPFSPPQPRAPKQPINRTASLGSGIPVAEMPGSSTTTPERKEKSPQGLGRLGSENSRKDPLRIDFSESPQSPDSQPVISYQDTIAALITQAKRYPERALKRGISGEGRVKIELLPNGSIKSSDIIQSTSSPILDQEIQEMILRAGPFPPFPSGLGKSSLSFVVPVSFAISEH